MQAEIAKIMTEFFTAVTNVYVDSAKKTYDANVSLSTEMIRAMTRATSPKK